MPSIVYDRFFLTKQDLKALCAFASSDAARADLNHVVFDAHEGRIFASDGHTLLRVTPRRSDFLPASAPFRFGVPRETLEGLSRSLSKGQELAVYMTAGKIEIATVHETAREVPVVNTAIPYDGDLAFPYYEQVVPNRGYEQPGTSSAFNAEYLTRLLLVQRASGTPGLDAFAPEGPLDASRFEASRNGTDWLVMIMPLRSDRAMALEQERKPRARKPKLSADAEEKLAIPRFRRVVERMATLSVADVTRVERMLTAFAPVPTHGRSPIAESSHVEGLA